MSQPAEPLACRRCCCAAEHREQREGSGGALKGPILELTASAGLQDDCPFEEALLLLEDVETGHGGGGGSSGKRRVLVAEDAEGISDEAFDAYAARLYQYLQASLRLRPSLLLSRENYGSARITCFFLHCLLTTPFRRAATGG